MARSTPGRARFRRNTEVAPLATGVGTKLESIHARLYTRRRTADITGNVWKLLAQQGEKVSAGDPLLILEAMKMEFQIAAPHDGVAGSFHCRPGMMISAGDPLVSLV
ncbi:MULTISPECIES: acetyl-CoA carboxylase biotin carboxyl carrier protein subunit [Pandoraea]|nr:MULTISPECIES: acetyl-CoA carboxylase biotin carboxyl carrier protein subunit [Pandoraea]